MKQIPKSNRRTARERVLQILYAYRYRGEGLEELCSSFLIDLATPEDRLFGRNLTDRTLIFQKDFDEIIEKQISHWELDRIAVIDLILLRMAICELLHFPDVPVKVTLNEYISLAKEFSTPQSGRFINGILDPVAEQLSADKKLNKTGRGLMTRRTAPRGKKSE